MTRAVIHATHPPRASRRGRAAFTRARSTCGQASVELVALLPLVALIGCAVFSVIAANAAHEQAGEAAEAGAVALLEGGDAHAAAVAALPEAVRSRSMIAVRGERVHVRVRPGVPVLASYLAGSATAAAGAAAVTP